LFRLIDQVVWGVKNLKINGGDKDFWESAETQDLTSFKTFVIISAWVGQ
jgi:hypothetical protein